MSKTSMLRTNPDACPLAVKCGGCQLQNMTYERQLRWKQARVEILLKRFTKPERIIGMADPTHYRHKVQAAFGRGRDGKPVSGIYQSSTHRIVPMDSCMIEDAAADAIIVTVRRMLAAYKLRPFDDVAVRGFLRHVLVRKGYATGQIMVVLVTGTREFPNGERFVEELVSRHPEITTVVQNVNGRRTGMVLGESCRTLYGQGYIEDELCGLTFRLSPTAFYQINPPQTEILYRKAIEFAGLTGKETVVDAYCGTGTIGLIASAHAGQVVGVELNADAVRDARENARRNGRENIRFFCADAGEFLEQAAAEGDRADVLLMDPPRAGSTRQFIEAVAVMKPRRVVYVSCDPETLARDLALFVKKGYAVERLCPVDMFPYTRHVECVVQLTAEP